MERNFEEQISMKAIYYWHFYYCFQIFNLNLLMIGILIRLLWKINFIYLFIYILIVQIVQIFILFIELKQNVKK